MSVNYTTKTFNLEGHTDGNCSGKGSSGTEHIATGDKSDEEGLKNYLESVKPDIIGFTTDLGGTIKIKAVNVNKPCNMECNNVQECVGNLLK